MGFHSAPSLWRQNKHVRLSDRLRFLTHCSFCLCLLSVRLRAAAPQLISVWSTDEFLSWEKLQSTQLFSSFSDSFCPHLVSSCSHSFHHLVIKMCFSVLPREAKNGYHLWLAESYMVLRLQAVLVKWEKKNATSTKMWVHLLTCSLYVGVCLVKFPEGPIQVN